MVRNFDIWKSVETTAIRSRYALFDISILSRVGSNPLPYISRTARCMIVKFSPVVGLHMEDFVYYRPESEKSKMREIAQHYKYDMRDQF